MPFSIYDDSMEYGPLSFSEVFWDEQSFNDKVRVIGGDTDLTGLYDILALKYATATTRYYMEEAFILAIRRELAVAWPAYKKQKAVQDLIYNLSSDELVLQLEIIKAGNRQSENDEEYRNTNMRVDTNEVNSTVENTGDVLTNTVNASNSPIVDASTVAIKNKSNQQSNVNQNTKNETTGTTSSQSNDANDGVRTNKVDDIYQENFRQIGNKLAALNEQYANIMRDYQKTIYRKTDQLFKVILAS